MTHITLNPVMDLTLTLMEEHVVMTDIQVQSTSGVPCTDLAVHAIKLNDWQMFLQEYHFRCLNVALTEQEVEQPKLLPSS